MPGRSPTASTLLPTTNGGRTRHWRTTSSAPLGRRFRPEPQELRAVARHNPNLPCDGRGAMLSNHQRVTEGFEVLTGVLAPYVAAEIRAKYGDEWWNQGVLRILHQSQRRDLPPDGEDDELVHRLDAGRCLILIDGQWDDIFRRKMSREHRTWVKELIATRNRWAHKGLLDMADEDAWRALDTMTRMVEQIDAEATERLRALARVVRYGTAGPSTATDKVEERKPAVEDRVGVLTAAPRAGLKPWRQVARPHPDVAAGRYRQAEFAADLSPALGAAVNTP